VRRSPLSLLFSRLKTPSSLSHRSRRQEALGRATDVNTATGSACRRAGQTTRPQGRLSERQQSGQRRALLMKGTGHEPPRKRLTNVAGSRGRVADLDPGASTSASPPRSQTLAMGEGSVVYGLMAGAGEGGGRPQVPPLPRGGRRSAAGRWRGARRHHRSSCQAGPGTAAQNGAGREKQPMAGPVGGQVGRGCARSSGMAT